MPVQRSSSSMARAAKAGRSLLLCAALSSMALWPPSLGGQESEPATSLIDTMLADLHLVSRQLASLAEVIPEESFAWYPGEAEASEPGDPWETPRSVSRVFMHVSTGVYLQMQALEVPIPRGSFRGLANLEELTDPTAVKETLRHALAHAETHLGRLHAAGDLDDPEAQAGVFTIQTHLHEHLGQMIAYARVLGIKPPWSEREAEWMRQTP